MIHYKEFRGALIEPYIEQIAQLRMQIFKEWPYLYEGTMEYEKKYLQTYVKTPFSFVVLAFDETKLIGVTTSILASQEEEAFQTAFIKQGIYPETVCYFGESILLPEYRGKGIGKEFMQRRLDFARQLPGVKFASFCSVQRNLTHPLRPLHYRPLDSFWRQMGFEPIKGMETEYSWLDVGDKVETKKKMQFWLRAL